MYSGFLSTRLEKFHVSEVICFSEGIEHGTHARIRASEASSLGRPSPTKIPVIYQLPPRLFARAIHLQFTEALRSLALGIPSLLKR
jgi:hypothetical protein